MVGYGKEDSHFVVELTYNYGIKAYAKGNDFQVNCADSASHKASMFPHNYACSGSVSIQKVC